MHRNKEKMAPVLIAHSFGGIVAMKFLESCYRDSKSHLNLSALSGVVLCNSVPPSGYRSMTIRTLKQMLLQKSWLIVQGFVLKKAAVDPSICKTLFFSNEPNCIKDEQLKRYIQHFEEDSKIGADLVALNRVLPSVTCMNQVSGQAHWMEDTDVQSHIPKRLVLGGTEDFIVDTDALAETATYMGIKEGAISLPEVYHDSMLGSKWKDGADYISNWLKVNFPH